MTRERFEQIAQEVFNQLPEYFRARLDNVRIVVEDFPSEDESRSAHARKETLLGLYQGIPLTRRGTWYGMSPVAPDTISLYQANIEASAGGEEKIRQRLREVLFHEVGHYFGMTETQIRNAMRNFQ